jgi:hypothetical protein
MESLALALSLVTGVADLDRRCLEDELGRFPPPAIVTQQKAAAIGHIQWLIRQVPRNEATCKRQCCVIEPYRLLERARFEKSYLSRRKCADELRKFMDGGDYRGDYRRGRLPAPILGIDIDKLIS